MKTWHSYYCWFRSWPRSRWLIQPGMLFRRDQSEYRESKEQRARRCSWEQSQWWHRIRDRSVHDLHLYCLVSLILMAERGLSYRWKKVGEWRLSSRQPRWWKPRRLLVKPICDPRVPWLLMSVMILSAWHVDRLTEITEQGAEECTCLEGRGDVAWDTGSGSLCDAKVALEAGASNGGAYKGRVITKARICQWGSRCRRLI